MVAITGANGLVGSYIVRKLVEEGIPVVAVMRKDASKNLLEGVLEKIMRREADVTDTVALAEAFVGVDAVVHTAGVVSFSRRNTERIFEINAGGTQNVVNTCLTLKVPKLIHISSVAALGRVKGVDTITEETRWAHNSLNTDYGLSKYMAEREVYRGVEEGLSASLINPSIVLAPAEWDNSSAQVFQYIWKERPFFTDGSLNYVDARDVAEMVFRIYRGEFGGHKFIANAGIIPLLRFFQETARRFHKKPPYLRVSHGLTGVVAIAEEMRSWITGKDPLVTRQSARLARETFYYDAGKSVELLQMRYRTLEETLDWCCAGYLQKVTTNK